MDALEAQIDKVNDKVSEVETNYLNKFTQIERHVTKEKEEIIEKIHELQIQLLTHKRNEKN